MKDEQNDFDGDDEKQMIVLVPGAMVTTVIDDDGRPH